MTWERHVNLVLKVLLRALSILQAEAHPDESEIDLNRQLYFCLLRANRELYESTGEAFDHQPTPEAKNPPDPDDEQRAKRENKSPDFLWGFIDHSAPDATRGARNFYIECKRLGKPKRSDWPFNKNYIQHGVLRFVTKEHAYAKGEKAAAMVGYIESMDFDDILGEVNKAASDASVPNLDGPLGGWQISGTSSLYHHLIRPFKISPFYLHHFWVDIRKEHRDDTRTGVPDNDD